jgi:heptaprenylglyceryl phosphate synthase
MIGKIICGYWGAGIEPTVAKVTGYTKTKAGDTYFAAREIETNKVFYLYGSEIMPGPVPSYGPAELGWYHEEVA